jgi:hypothetical protein
MQRRSQGTGIRKEGCILKEGLKPVDCIHICSYAMPIFISIFAEKRHTINVGQHDGCRQVGVAMCQTQLQRSSRRPTLASTLSARVSVAAIPTGL